MGEPRRIWPKTSYLRDNGKKKIKASNDLTHCRFAFIVASKVIERIEEVAFTGSTQDWEC